MRLSVDCERGTKLARSREERRQKTQIGQKLRKENISVKAN